MKNTEEVQSKINDLILIEALGFYICDNEPLIKWLELNRANETGEGEAPAIDFCDPVQGYEHDTVSQLINQIDQLRDQLDSFLNRVEKVKASA